MSEKPGYHLKSIAKHPYQSFEKIEEELLEAKDALEQDSKIMLGVELSDLIGAIEGYAEKHLNLTLDDLIKMKDITKRAFQNGRR